MASLAGNTSFDQVNITEWYAVERHADPKPDRQFDELELCIPERVHGGQRWHAGRESRTSRWSIAGGQTLTDAGAVSFSSGDVVTLEDSNGCYTSAYISVSGSLTSNGATFSNNSVASGNITFGPTGTISGANNTYNLPVYVPYTDVASLAGNTSFDQVNITDGTLSSGTLTLNPIGNSTSLSYAFPNGFTVANGGTLAVSANVAVVGRGGPDAD